MPRWRRAAMAMPTALLIPAPSGPVVVSTNLVCPYSGCPGVREPKVRSDSMSSSSRPSPPRYSCEYCRIEACPAERTKRSRPIHLSSVGSVFITFWYSR